MLKPSVSSCGKGGRDGLFFSSVFSMYYVGVCDAKLEMSLVAVAGTRTTCNSIVVRGTFTGR